MIKVGDQLPGLFPRSMTSNEIEEDKKLRNQRQRDRRYKPVENKVYYIHPQLRYLTVEFILERGSFRESFLIRNRRILCDQAPKEGSYE